MKSTSSFYVLPYIIPSFQEYLAYILPICLFNLFLIISRLPGNLIRHIGVLMWCYFCGRVSFQLRKDQIYVITGSSDTIYLIHKFATFQHSLHPPPHSLLLLHLLHRLKSTLNFLSSEDLQLCILMTSPMQLLSQVSSEMSMFFTRVIISSIFNLLFFSYFCHRLPFRETITTCS